MEKEKRSIYEILKNLKEINENEKKLIEELKALFKGTKQ